jgi:hypothetical protein
VGARKRESAPAPSWFDGADDPGDLGILGFPVVMGIAGILWTEDGLPGKDRVVKLSGQDVKGREIDVIPGSVIAMRARWTDDKSGAWVPWTARRPDGYRGHVQVLVRSATSPTVVMLTARGYASGSLYDSAMVAHETCRRAYIRTGRRFALCAWRLVFRAGSEETAGKDGRYTPILSILSPPTVEGQSAMEGAYVGHERYRDNLEAARAVVPWASEWAGK